MTPTQHQARDGAADGVGPRMTIPVDGIWPRPFHVKERRRTDTTVDMSWQDQANCNGCDVDMFFPERGDSAAARDAKKICYACPVRTQCLTHAMTTGEKYGILGGLSAKERQRLRGAKRRMA